LGHQEVRSFVPGRTPSRYVLLRIGSLSFESTIEETGVLGGAVDRCLGADRIPQCRLQSLDADTGRVYVGVRIRGYTRVA
jgi:hypothetical protein